MLRSGRDSRDQGDTTVGGGGEKTFLVKGPGMNTHLETHVVVEGQQKGIQATTEEETAVVCPAGAHGREAGGQLGPGMTGGELPENGIEEGTRAVDPLARAPARRRAEETRATLEDAIMLTHDLKVGRVVPRGVVREAPAVGGDNDRRATADKVTVRIRRDEGLK